MWRVTAPGFASTFTEHILESPSTDLFPYIFIFLYFAGGLSRPLVSLITTTKVQRLAHSKFNVSINRADNKRESNRAFKLRATPSLFQSENQSQYTAQNNRKITAAKHATPPHRLPPENVKTPKTLNIRSPP